MWNETRGTASVVDRAVGKQTGVWQESPLVGVDALLKRHQAVVSAAFRLSERPFLELVNLRGDPRAGQERNRADRRSAPGRARAAAAE